MHWPLFLWGDGMKTRGQRRKERFLDSMPDIAYRGADYGALEAERAEFMEDLKDYINKNGFIDGTKLG